MWKKYIPLFMGVSLCNYGNNAIAAAGDKVSVKALQKQIEILQKDLAEIKKNQDKISIAQDINKLELSEMVKKGLASSSFNIPGTDLSLSFHGLLRANVSWFSRVNSLDTSAMDSKTGKIPLKGTDNYKKGGKAVFAVHDSFIGLKLMHPTSFGNINGNIDFEVTKAGKIENSKLNIVFDWAKHSLHFGKNISLFSSGRACDNSKYIYVIGSTPVGLPGHTAMYAAYDYMPSDKWSFSVALEIPTTTYNITDDIKENNEIKYASKDDNGAYKDYSNSDSLSFNKMPDALMGVFYKGDFIDTSVRFVFSSPRVAGFNDKETFKYQKRGFAIAHSSTLKLSDKTKLMYDVLYGRNLSGYVAGGAGTILNVEDGKVKGMFLQPILAFNLGLSHKLTDNLQLNAVASSMRIYNNKAMRGKQVNRWIREINCTAMYSFSKHMRAGVGYMFGQRKVENRGDDNKFGKKTHLHRLQLSLLYSF